MKFCKDVLGVQRQTTNAGVLLELGRIPLCVYTKKNCIKSWDRIALEEKSNIITKTSYDWVTLTNIGWAHFIKEDFSHMNCFLVKKGTRKVVSSVVLNREKYIFYQLAFYNIKLNSCKLLTFAKIKTTIGIESYLTKIHNITDRISMSKFRLSTHRLMIEKGRHNNLAVHFLFHFPTYSSMRVHLMEKIGIRNEYPHTYEFIS